jgi:CDP-diacylglycerol--serine O-phosphatidyltransferase
VSAPARPVHLSMIRGFHLADFLTLANAACGVLAVFAVMSYIETRTPRRLLAATALIPLALVFDVLDGRVARWRHVASPMGRELDSLADVISFGVAPAGIAYAAGLDRVADQVILMYFVGCGVSRLARYNVTAADLSRETGKVTYFEGTPIPTSVVPLGLLMLAFHHQSPEPVRFLGLELHLVALLFLISGSLMISKTLRIPKP